MFGQIVAILEADSKAEGKRSKVWVAEEGIHSRYRLGKSNRS
jgi:hypothetical protein